MLGEREDEVVDEGSVRPAVLLRALVGGILMGLANLVPGISGGTMLLASGIYPRFIAAIAELSTLRFRVRSVLVLGVVVVAAVLGVVLFAGTVKDLVVERRWVMYSLFIGLTLGGVPIVWRLARPITPGVWGGAIVGFLAMVGITVAQMSGTGVSSGGDGSFLKHGLAGLAGASAMILPGISGGYLLLLMNEYIPILSAIDAVKVALQARDIGAALGPGLSVVLPVGIGVVLGVVGVSNLLRYLLARFSKPTLGALLGLLVGAVVGLWPFQRPISPVPGETVIKGQVVTLENLAEFEVEDFPTERFTPTGGQVGAAIGIMVAGLAFTFLLAKVSSDDTSRA
ncbi:MAG: DUF368 domain-containing protein [Candidatus Eisenbacteria bacterium]|uniref:DUF368 domain-containing protein n=1 Tax=Eiseniibacteriota bacterium TaxID=2212470 RepID=A0A956NB41_UNCEI|nr:DUF368 domain-containing protein [Candidatus Eisenbacteria bacterium]MCB9462217.1 DUF368 domain-containing protein [Candidatus Eisenbacteria bacterium]